VADKGITHSIQTRLLDHAKRVSAIRENDQYGGQRVMPAALQVFPSLSPAITDILISVYPLRRLYVGIGSLDHQGVAGH
jgi:hypothetical protein